MKRALFSILLLLTALPATAQDFPLSIETKFGSSVIEAPPERVASIDYAGADDLLALGVQPVAIRYWYGDYERVVWPWADPLLGELPVVLRGDLDFEAIAVAKPDVIVALWSGIDAEAYDKLSRIAPVVAVPPGVGDYEMPWDERALLTGTALGREAEARAQVQAIRDRLAAVAAGHPDWAGQSAAVAYAWNGAGAYTSNDVRPQILERMGFVTPPAVEALMTDPGQFTVTFSLEDLSPLDGDLLIWLTSEDSFAEVNALIARPFLGVVRAGHEVFADTLLSGAFSHASLLSLPYAIDTLVPLIEAALDGAGPSD